MRGSFDLRPVSVVVLATFGLVTLARALGFGDGFSLGATPASAVALAGAIVLRGKGALAAAAGFGLAGLAWGLGPLPAAVDAAAHGGAALAASQVMRAMARRRRSRTRTSDWLIFLAGSSLFTVVVAAAALAAAAAGALGPAAAPWRTAALAAAFEPFGLLTGGALLASLGEASRVRADPRPAAATAAVAATLLVVLWVALRLPVEALRPSGLVLITALPFCLWVAMQRRSLDGAVIAFVASHLALVMLLQDLGSVGSGQFVLTMIYLVLLVAICQLVHAVNLDRLAAMLEVEARKADLEARVAERTARLSAMIERTLAADAAKTRFLAIVSHEVRTPLNGVLGMASVVLAGDLPPDARRNIEVIRASGFHLLDVINRILDYAKLDHGRGASDEDVFDVGDLVEEVLREARFLPYAAGLDVRAEFAPGLARRRLGDRQGLRQVLTNLVGNAAKFTEAGSVVVRARDVVGGVLRVDVRDTGRGVAAEEQARIFLPFEQSGEPLHRRQSGTGLGLSICADVIGRMGGRLGVESAVGAGSLFWFEVPAPVLSGDDAAGASGDERALRAVAGGGA